MILGGGGFIGANIARHLFASGTYDITVADRYFGSRFDDLVSDGHRPPRIRFIEGDFSDPAAFRKLDSQYDHVYMMAAIVGVNTTLAYPEEVIRVNTGLVHHSLAWLSSASVGRVVFASSSENYAASTDIFDYRIPTPESVPLTIADVRHPRWTYAITKILGESAYLHTGPKAGFEATIVRYQNAYGPDMGFRHAIPHIIQRFHESQDPFLIYGADQTRAFCYITDTVNGTIRAMESPRAAGEIYHIGNNEEITLRTLTVAIGDMLGFQGVYSDAPTYPGSVSRRCPDIRKATEELGYTAAVPWHEGVLRTVQWYSEFFKSGRRLDTKGFEPPDLFTS